jgi:hypothetical protein
MNCRECHEATAAWLEGLLDEPAKAAFKAHISECEECRAEADGAARMYVSLSGQREAVGSVRERVMTTISKRAIRPRRIDVIRRHIRGFATAAAAAAMVLAGMFWWMTAGTRAHMSAYAALEEAVENSQAAEWVHMAFALDGTQCEIWFSFSPHRKIVKDGSKGEITYADYAAGEKRVYKKLSNSIHTSRVGLSGRENAGSMLDWLSDSMTRAEDDRRYRVTNESAHGVQTWTIAGEREVLSASIDTRQKRVTGIVRQETEADGSKRTVRYRVDYPQRGPADIYEAGAPRDATVVAQPQSDHGIDLESTSPAAIRQAR